CHLQRCRSPLPPLTTAEAPPHRSTARIKVGGWHHYGLLMLPPFPLSAIVAQSRRPSSIAARCRRPPWLGHLGPPRSEPWPGVEPSQPPPPFPLTPEPPRALGRRVWPHRRAAGPSPVFPARGRKRTGIF